MCLDKLNIEGFLELDFLLVNTYFSTFAAASITIFHLYSLVLRMYVAIDFYSLDCHHTFAATFGLMKYTMGAYCGSVFMELINIGS